jgi:hypothetical protein
VTVYDDLILSDAPLFYWPLDDLAGTTAVDLSGNARHGTYHGTPTLGEPGPRACQDPASRAAFFSGDGYGAAADYVHRATSPISGTMDFTLEVWFRPAADAFTRPGRRYMNLIQQRGPGPTTSGFVRVFTNIEDALGAPTGFGVSGGSSDSIIVGSLEDVFRRVECWNHVALTRSGDLFRLYLNTVLLGAALHPGAISGSDLSFGADYADVGRIGDEEQELFRGRMAKAAGYGRALSPAELAERYAMGCTGCGAGFHVGTIGFGGVF